MEILSLLYIECYEDLRSRCLSPACVDRTTDSFLVAEVPTVIQLLTQSPPSIQQATIARYFTSSASFTHPFCRTGSYDLAARLPYNGLRSILREGGPLPLLSSRALIGGIYRWYKVLSPEIELGIDSIAFDAEKLIVYVSLHQTFRCLRLPGLSAPVNLVTVLELQQSKGFTSGRPEKTRYLIKSQNDRYQVDEWLKFVSIFRIVWALFLLASFVATILCVAGQAVCWPLVGLEERWGAKKAHQKAEKIEHANGEQKKES
jgi:hypothetical protein